VSLKPEDKNYLLSIIRDVQDFPKPGIVFKDITTLLNNPQASKFLMHHLIDRYKPMELDFIAGAESRGFLFGAPLAHALGVGFVPIRKPGKLPFTTVSEKYALEYGFDEVEIHIDAFRAKEKPRVLFIDDLIATGGTAEASIKLIEQVGAKCVEACFVIELGFLAGREKIEKFTECYSVLQVE
jgi:adenine phosphoribosyltransferase